MIIRKWIGIVATLLSFIAGQLTYFHLHNHGLEEHLHLECSLSNQSSQTIVEDCDICDFLYLQYENHTESSFDFAIEFIREGVELFTADPYCLKPNKLYFNKAPPFSC